MHHMCRKIYHWPVFVLILTAAGCAKDFNLNLDNTTPLYVIEGRISNLEGPYFVRITKTSNQLSLGVRDSAEAVTGALVILSDNTGTKDTLIPVDQSRITRYWYILRPDGSLDSMADNFESAFYTRERGYYQTTRIKGTPGHTYHLEVQTGQETFHADAYMPYVPALDSAEIKETAVIPEGAKGLLPFVYFKEPDNEKNYYLLQFNDATDFRYDIPERYGYWGAYFPFYVVDDKILPSYVNGLAVRVIFSGHSSYSGSNYFSISPNNTQQVKLSSLTKEAYEYFKVLISQFEDDGNAYKPVPASAAGNISGGALGLFYATHVSYKLVRP
jgi:hypothetical protein